MASWTAEQAERARRSGLLDEPEGGRRRGENATAAFIRSLVG